MKNPITLKHLIEHQSFVLCPFLTTDKFVSFCKERAIHTSEGQLEQFEKLGLFFPVARVKFPKIKIKVEFNPELKQRKYFGVLKRGKEWEGDIKEEYAGFGWSPEYAKTWSENGLLWDPSSAEFQAWKNFRDNDGYKQIESYYSIFQCYTLYNLKRRIEISIRPEILYDDDDIKRNYLVEQTSEMTKACINATKKHGMWGEEAPFLCQAISNRFFPKTQSDQRNINLSIPTGLRNKWDWDEYCRHWNSTSVLNHFGVSLKEIEDLHERLSSEARNLDPLRDWYELVSFIAVEEKKRLRGKALFAQTLYAMEYMLRLFYKDISGKDLPRHSESTFWKLDQRYGEGITQDKPRYLEFLTNQYRLNPRPNLILVVEGKGEEEQFPRLSDELLGYSFSILGIEMMNVQGIGGFTGKKGIEKYGALEKYIDYFHSKQTIVFVILDDEGNGLARTVRINLLGASSKYNKERMVTQPEYIYLWGKKTIEFDNFSHGEISKALSELSEGTYNFSAEEIRRCEEQLKIKESDKLRQLFEEKTKHKLNKPELLRILFGYIINNGDSEFDDKRIPVRTVVKILHKVIELASQNYQPTCHDSWERNQKSGFFGDIKNKS